MEKFNENTREIDKQLKAANEAATEAVANGLKIATGSYTGDGTYGADHPVTLTFPFSPKALFLMNCDGNSGMKAPMFLVAPYTLQTVAEGTAGGYELHVTWDGNTVSWYGNYDAKAQFNTAYGTNYYIAFG